MANDECLVHNVDSQSDLVGNKALGNKKFMKLSISYPRFADTNIDKGRKKSKIILMWDEFCPVDEGQFRVQCQYIRTNILASFCLMDHVVAIQIQSRWFWRKQSNGADH